jgi:hypothetical protein
VTFVDRCRYAHLIDVIVDDDAVRVTPFEVVFQPRVSQGFRVIGVEARHKFIAGDCERVVLPP